MLTKDFDFTYPESLVALEPRADHRILSGVGATSSEISKTELFELFQPNDVLVINDTRVLPRRVTSPDGLEILFLREISSAANEWEVLFPAREVKDNQDFSLPGGASARLVQRGLPQTLRVDTSLDENYFTKFGELAIPPYIQKARGERANRPEEKIWYQTAWAEKPGSQAAPTASLHFTKDDLAQLRARGVKIATVTLHVGMGTFLPIKTARLDEHKMHAEEAFISAATIETLVEAKNSEAKIWALGTTSLRALESWGRGLLKENSEGDFTGATDLFIRPGFQFEVVDGLLTNFHQPQSTLLALVSAFAGREHVLKAYAWAVANRFRLFSYGDLTVWKRQ